MKFNIQYLVNHTIKNTEDIEANSKEEAINTFWNSESYPATASILSVKESSNNKIIKG